MFNFKRLTNKYSKEPVYLLRVTEGYYDWEQGGIWIPSGEEEIEIKGAVVPLSNEDLQFDEGGTYTTEDRKLYCYEEIDKGEKIKHKEKIYTVIEKKDYSDFAKGLSIYFLKRAGD